MEIEDADKLFRRGLEDLARSDALSALACFEKAVELEDRPIFCSYLALSIALAKGQFQLAVTLCEKAIAREPRTGFHYLNLGKIYLMAGKNEEAVRTFRNGVRHEKNPEVLEQLSLHGTRKPPVIPFLHRDNFLNKYLGIFLRKVRLR